MKKHIDTILRGFLLLQALIFSSCHVLHEDMSECDLFLKFKYDYNLSYKDWFADQVEEIKVFIYDKDGRFVEMIRETTPTIAIAGFKIKIPYEMKGYTTIVWAGKTDRDYSLSLPKVGEEVEKLMLAYKPKDNISSHQIDALWQSGPHIMTFPEAGGTEQTISLIRNTNHFHITLRPIETTADGNKNFEIKIKGANGSYNHKNEILKGTSDIEYRPTGEEPHSTSNLYTLRLVEGERLLISVKDPVSGRYINIGGATEAALIELLLKGKPQNMTNQEYLDRRYIWEITLDYNPNTYLAISITINGWVHWFHNIDI